MGNIKWKEKGLRIFNTQRHFLSELSRHNALEIFFQVFSFKEACTLSASKPLPTPTQELWHLCVRQGYVYNCNVGSSLRLNHEL